MNSPLDDEVVTIAEVDSQPEYLVIRSVLDSAGIECSSPDFADFYVKGKNSSGGVIRVQVRASQAEDAVSILRGAEANPIPAEPDDNQL